MDCTERGRVSEPRVEQCWRPNTSFILSMAEMIPKQKDVVRSPPFPTITRRPKQPLKADRVASRPHGLRKPSPRSTLVRAYPAFSCRASPWAPWHRLPLLSPPWYHRPSLNEVRGVARCGESAQVRTRAAGACAPNPTPRARHSTPGVKMRGWEIHPVVFWPPLCSPKEPRCLSPS